MTEYIHRDKNGTMKAVYNSDVMRHITLLIDGFWRVYKTDKFTTRAYEISEDHVFFVGNRIQIYMWTGDVIVER